MRKSKEKTTITSTTRPYWGIANTADEALRAETSTSLYQTRDQEESSELLPGKVETDVVSNFEVVFVLWRVKLFVPAAA